LARPQSVFELQKVLSREGERRYTRLSMSEKIRLQIDTFVSDTRKPAGKAASQVGKAGAPLV
jgi:hypothetical protein